MEPTRPSETPGIPLWVKVSGIITLVVVLLFVVLLVTRGPHRGPSNHMPFGGSGGRTATAAAMFMEYHAPPEGGLG